MYQDYKFRREFASEIIEAAFFGAFMVAIDARKNEDSLTQAELAKRTGKEKTGISKLLAGPRNWKLSTISDLAEALDLRLEFVLIDQHQPQRRFTQTGVAFAIPHNTSLNVDNLPLPINSPQQAGNSNRLQNEGCQLLNFSLDESQKSKLPLTISP